jgi:hypothetical protein
MRLRLGSDVGTLGRWDVEEKLLLIIHQLIFGKFEVKIEVSYA